jgi:LacI family transcriptional regulator
VLGANDLLAIATMHLVTERGLRVPHDVAVVGMDDTELADVTSPALTSVDLAALDRGRAAAQLLLDRLEQPDRPVQRVTIQPRLSVRGSSDLGGERR